MGKPGEAAVADVRPAKKPVKRGSEEYLTGYGSTPHCHKGKVVQSDEVGDSVVITPSVLIQKGTPSDVCCTCASTPCTC